MTINPRPNPYPGPRAFQRGEKLYGRRARDRRNCWTCWSPSASCCSHCPPGAGKSSLVQAGLCHACRTRFLVLPVSAGNLGSRPRSGFSERAGFNRYVFDTLVSLEEGYAGDQRLPLDELASLSVSAYLDLHRGQPLRASSRMPASPRRDSEVLIFDQFEEVLTVNPTDLPGKQAFFDQVGAALEERRRWALFSMREEHIAALDPYVRAVPGRFGNPRRFRLDLLGQAGCPPGDRAPARRRPGPVGRVR